MPEYGRRAIFRKVVNFRFIYVFLYFTFHTLYFIHIKDDAQSPTNNWFTMVYTIVKTFQNLKTGLNQLKICICVNCTALKLSEASRDGREENKREYKTEGEKVREENVWSL